MLIAYKNTLCKILKSSCIRCFKFFLYCHQIECRSIPVPNALVYVYLAMSAEIMGQDWIAMFFYVNKLMSDTRWLIFLSNLTVSVGLPFIKAIKSGFWAYLNVFLCIALIFQCWNIANYKAIFEMNCYRNAQLHRHLLQREIACCGTYQSSPFFSSIKSLLSTSGLTGL